MSLHYSVPLEQPDKEISDRSGSSQFIDLAPRRRRCLAALADGIFLSIAGIAVGTLYRLSGISSSRLWLEAFCLMLISFYFIVAYSTSGQTVGKRLLDIKVISLEGKPLNWRNGVLRYIGLIMGAIPFFAGYWWTFIDYYKQAAHDKIAKTIVVKASVPAYAAAELYRPIQARRQRWLTIGILGMLSFMTVREPFNAIAEVRAMGPWPGPNVAPSTLVNIDFSHLGLALSISEDARRINSVWSGGNFKKGAVAIYQSRANEVAGIWLLNYETTNMAAYGFGAGDSLIGGHWFYDATANGTCISASIIYVIGTGRALCDMGNAYEALYWNDKWLLHIVTLEGSRYSPQELSVLIRDALTANWKRSLGSS